MNGPAECTPCKRAAFSNTIRAASESSLPNPSIHTSRKFSNFLLACSFLFLSFFYKDINKSLQPEPNRITWLWEKHMANRLSLQSATCSAFQLQLCRQPHNDNDTKTVSFVGSDCTRALQSPHTIRQPDEALLCTSLFTYWASCLWEKWGEKEIASVYFPVCAIVYVSVQYVYVESTVRTHTRLSRGGEESLLLFCSDVSLLLRGALHSCHLHVAL